MLKLGSAEIGVRSQNPLILAKNVICPRFFHEYEISEDGLYEKTAANETKTNWNGITDIRRLRHYMLIQIDPGLFHVIPDSSFENEEEFNNFYSASRKFWKDA